MQTYALAEYMNTSQTSNKQRVQFDFSPEALERLENIRKHTDATTKAEVVRSALKLYEWFVTQVHSESTVEIQDKDNNVIFRIPAKILLS